MSDNPNEQVTIDPRLLDNSVDETTGQPGWYDGAWDADNKAPIDPKSYETASRLREFALKANAGSEDVEPSETVDPEASDDSDTDGDTGGSQPEFEISDEAKQFAEDHGLDWTAYTEVMKEQGDVPEEMRAPLYRYFPKSIVDAYIEMVKGQAVNNQLAGVAEKVGGSAVYNAVISTLETKDANAAAALGEYLRNPKISDQAKADRVLLMKYRYGIGDSSGSAKPAGPSQLAGRRGSAPSIGFNSPAEVKAEFAKVRTEADRERFTARLAATKPENRVGFS